MQKKRVVLLMIALGISLACMLIAIFRSGSALLIRDGYSLMLVAPLLLTGTVNHVFSIVGAKTVWMRVLGCVILALMFALLVLLAVTDTAHYSFWSILLMFLQPPIIDSINRYKAKKQTETETA